MTSTEILDEIMKNFSNLPTNGSYSELMKAQQKAFQASDNLIKHELSSNYHKGYQDATKFFHDKELKRQQKQN